MANFSDPGGGEVGGMGWGRCEMGSDVGTAGGLEAMVRMLAFIPNAEGNHRRV